MATALKSRSIPAAEAVSASLAALRWLRAAGCRQFFFKYCSTFDSTDAGNIGPVTEALLDALGAPFTLALPAATTGPAVLTVDTPGLGCPVDGLPTSYFAQVRDLTAR